MSKQKNIKVNVKLKHIRDDNQWYYKGTHQKTLTAKDIARLNNGDTLRMKTINAPKHTERTLERKRRLVIGKRN